MMPASGRKSSGNSTSDISSRRQGNHSSEPRNANPPNTWLSQPSGEYRRSVENLDGYSNTGNAGKKKPAYMYMRSIEDEEDHSAWERPRYIRKNPEPEPKQEPERRTSYEPPRTKNACNRSENIALALCVLIVLAGIVTAILNHGLTSADAILMLGGIAAVISSTAFPKGDRLVPVFLLCIPGIVANIIAFVFLGTSLALAVCLVLLFVSFIGSLITPQPE